MGLLYTLEFEIKGLPRINTADNVPWRKRQKEKELWYALVSIATRNKRPRLPLRRARLKITRHSAKRPDFVNLAQGAKFIEDGLVNCEVLADDNPDVVGTPEVPWQYAKRGQGFVSVTVQELEDEEPLSPPEQSVPPE